MRLLQLEQTDRGTPIMEDYGLVKAQVNSNEGTSSQLTHPEIIIQSAKGSNQGNIAVKVSSDELYTFVDVDGNQYINYYMIFDHISTYSLSSN